MVFSSGGTELRMGEGQASKIFVTHDGKSIQLNHLKEDESSTVETIVGEPMSRESLSRSDSKRVLR